MTGDGVNDHSHLGQLALELRGSIAAGAALAALGFAAGCGVPTEPSVDAPGGGGDSTLRSALEPVPSEAIGCFGPLSDQPMSWGPQCCFEASCYRPRDGASCMAADDPELGTAIELPPGSGSCGCQVLEEGRPAVSGPYATNAAATADGDSCCYVVGSVGCAGRPFVVSGDGRLAPLATRSDWRLFG
jgi:hypothetical protein